MSFKINSNLLSLQSQRYLGEGVEKRANALGRLASGKRILKAADDAATLSISTKIDSLSRSNQVVQRNTNDGISLIQVAEGGLNSIGDMLIRLRELAVQSSTDTYATSERYNLDKEFKSLKEEISRVSDSVEFNNRKLLNGEGGKIDVQIGVHNVNAEDRISIDLHTIDSTINTLFETGYSKSSTSRKKSSSKASRAVSFDPNYSSDSERQRIVKEIEKENKKASQSAAQQGHQYLNLRTKESSQTAIDALDVAINNLSKKRSLLGSIQNRMGSVLNVQQNSKINMDSSKSKMVDADFAKETAESIKEKIKGEYQTENLKNINNIGSNAVKLVNANL